MKITKRLLAIVMALVTLVSVVGISAEAANVYLSHLGLGYMRPTNRDGSKNISTVTLYGDYDYINFYVNAKKNNGYFGYEIYADKDYTKLKDSGAVACNKGKYNLSAEIKLKGNYSSRTYYLITYAAYIYSDGSVDFDQDSMKKYKIKVKRSASFDDKIVVLKGVKNTTKGAYISWSKLSGADKYYIYRRSVAGTKWTKVGSVGGSKTSFTDTSLTNASYVYTVKAINKNGVASRCLYFGPTCLFAKAPELKSVAVSCDDSIEIKWNSISPRAKYNILRKEDDGKWKTIETGYSGTEYTDDACKNGKTYTYSVKAVISTNYGDAVSSFYTNSKKALTFLKAPALGAVDVVETGLRVSWKLVSGASSYVIMRKPYDSSADWVKIGTVDSTVRKFTDTTANINEEYLYTVQSMGNNFEGSYSSKGVEYTKLGTPSDLKIYESGYHSKDLKLLWSNVTGAREYEIYRKVNSGEWKLFTSRNADYCGQYLYFFDYMGTYQFKVRAKAGEGHYGEFSEPVTMEYYPKIHFNSIVADKQISLTWSNYKADSYNLYRKEASQDDSQYVLVTNTTECKFVDTDVENDVLYTYQVRAVVEGKEQTLNLTEYAVGISTTLKKDVRIRTDDRVIDFYNANEVYGYNFGTGEWELLTGYDSKENTKENHAAYCQDGKYRYSFVFIDENGMKSIRENNITDHVWYSTVVDFSAEETADGMKITINNPSPEVVEYEICVGGSEKTIETNGASSYTCVFRNYYQGDSSTSCPTYSVTAKNANGDTSKTSKKFWYMDPPEIYSISKTSKGYVKLKIEQYKSDVEDWDGLYIYRKAAGESEYTKIKTIEMEPVDGFNYTTYYDKTAKSGVKYTYLVKCFKEYNGEMFVSYYDKATFKK